MKAFLVMLIVLSICNAALAQQPAQRPRAEAPPATPRPLICDPLNLLPGCHISGQSGATGQPVELYIWDKIINASPPDLQYASALAASAGTPSAGVRKQCWDALIAANKTASGTGLKDANGNALTKPDAHLFVDSRAIGGSDRQFGTDRPAIYGLCWGGAASEDQHTHLHQCDRDRSCWSRGARHHVTQR